MRADRQTDRQTDRTKPIVAFQNFATAPKDHPTFVVSKRENYQRMW